LVNGSPWNGAVVRHSVLAANANPIFIGDLIDLAGTASISPVDGAILHDITVVTAGSPNYGVVTGIIPTTGTPNLNITYGAASTYREVWVAVLEPNLILECSANTALTTAALGLQYDIVATAGSTTTGVSAMVLTSTPAATTGGGFQFWGIRADAANLATLTSSSTTIVASTSATPTIIEVLCVEPRVGLAVATVGV
jgi:hypothetical protein